MEALWEEQEKPLVQRTCSKAWGEVEYEEEAHVLVEPPEHETRVTVEPDLEA